ncbi:hypothetical protein I4U23_022873 [Adineta vaga]|nr:hypothetical protein I4U23_022873 [Adineta vaga]
MSYRPYQHSIRQPIFVDHNRSPRVVKIRGPDREIRNKMVEQWLANHYPGYQLIQTAKVKDNNRFYCRKTFRTADRRVKVVLFDFTEDAQREGDTVNRMFPGGTMIRVWARQGSLPTRIENFT